jgi:hypothetical protein
VEVFAPDEVAVVHVMNRVVRRCFLMGIDALTGKNYDYRKGWIEKELRRLAGLFGIDLLTFAILSNHYHLVLRSRPDVVGQWSDQEVARRWMLLCPHRKHTDGSAKEPSQAELNSIAGDADRLGEIRSRLSDISWWMRLLNQRIAQHANREDEASGKFWESRYRAIRLIDEEAILACSAYVDLNPIRAAIAETLEASDHTSVQLRIQSLPPAQTSGDNSAGVGNNSDHDGSEARCPDAFLSPVEIDEFRETIGPRPHAGSQRCSDKGFLSMPTGAYLELLDWTARHIAAGRRGATPAGTPAIFQRLKIKPAAWKVLATEFGKLFSVVAGQPHRLDDYRSRLRQQRYHLPSRTRELLTA